MDIAEMHCSYRVTVQVQTQQVAVADLQMRSTAHVAVHKLQGCLWCGDHCHANWQVNSLSGTTVV